MKKGAKAVGQFGKALANLAKNAGPAIATIHLGSKSLRILIQKSVDRGVIFNLLGVRHGKRKIKK